MLSTLRATGVRKKYSAFPQLPLDLSSFQMKMTCWPLAMKFNEIMGKYKNCYFGADNDLKLSHVGEVGGTPKTFFLTPVARKVDNISYSCWRHSRGQSFAFQTYQAHLMNSHTVKRTN